MISDLLHRKKPQIEYISPESVGQNSANSITTEDGIYDMTCFSRHEIAVVKTVLKNAWSGKYPNQAQGIGLANEAYPIKYKPRYVLHEIIIQKYSVSDNPLDLLAVAAAYRTKGAVGRSRAIQYYEKWLKVSSTAQKREATKYLFDAREPFFSYNLADLYQRENRLEEALKYATLAERFNSEHAPGFPLLIASIYKKMDIKKCVLFLQKVCTSKEYKNCPALHLELSKAKDLQSKGYMYKHSNHKQSKQDAAFEESVEIAAKQFLSGGGI